MKLEKTLEGRHLRQARLPTRHPSAAHLPLQPVAGCELTNIIIIIFISDSNNISHTKLVVQSDGCHRSLCSLTGRSNERTNERTNQQTNKQTNTTDRRNTSRLR